jgi:large subunit ribosomal protein L20
MARIKRGLASHRKHKKLLNQAKGYWMTRRRLVRKAKEAILHAGQAAYAGRKDKKGVARRDWILHINEALRKSVPSTVERPHINYSLFIHKLKLAKIELDRKILAQLATQHPLAFQAIIDKIKK